MLRHSSIVTINNHTDFDNCRWYLAMDKYRFHVYIIVVTQNQLYIRIDWNKNSTLTFEKYISTPDEDYYVVGHTGFCKLCIEELVVTQLKGYALFKFNCRTVSFLVLKVMGFNTKHLYTVFQNAYTLCGLKEDECLSIKEIGHFLDWEEGEKGCTIY